MDGELDLKLVFEFDEDGAQKLPLSFFFLQLRRTLHDQCRKNKNHVAGISKQRFESIK